MLQRHLAGLALLVGYRVDACLDSLLSVDSWLSTSFRLTCVRCLCMVMLTVRASDLLASVVKWWVVLMARLPPTPSVML